MNITDAASKLHARLKGSPWLTAVGVGEHGGSPCIFVYVKSLNRPELAFLQNGWQGFPVVVRKMASPRVLSVFRPKAPAPRQGKRRMAKGERPATDCAGAEVSEAEASSTGGVPASWEADRERLQRRVKAKTLVLRLDERDRKAVAGGLPGYTVYGLRHGATKLVQSASVTYRGLRREGRLKDGFAFCGRLPKAYDNEGKVTRPPEGMVYVVYADPDGYVFDWDWVREDPRHPGHPIDPELRFTGDPEAVVSEAVLVGLEDLSPARFNSQQAWPSPRGDCVFCYFSDEFAFADRINNDLTVFRSLATEDPTGFKVKNVQKILEEGVAQLAAPDMTVGVQAFLLATFRRNVDSDIQVYSVLIEAWIRRAANTVLPKITLPCPRETCHAAP